MKPGKRSPAFFCPFAGVIRNELSGSVPQIERRRWDRFSLTIPFFVRTTDRNGREFLEFSTALNVSAGGILLASRHDFDCGTRVSLDIPTPIWPIHVPRTGTLLQEKVLRSVPTRHYFLLGLQFESPLAVICWLP